MIFPSVGVCFLHIDSLFFCTNTVSSPAQKKSWTLSASRAFMLQIRLDLQKEKRSVPSPAAMLWDFREQYQTGF